MVFIVTLNIVTTPGILVARSAAMTSELMDGIMPNSFVCDDENISAVAVRFPNNPANQGYLPAGNLCTRLYTARRAPTQNSN